LNQVIKLLMPIGMLVAIGCSFVLPPAGIEERLAKLESQHPTPKPPQPPRPPTLQLHGNVSAEVAEGEQNTLSSLTFKVGGAGTPSFSVIRYTEYSESQGTSLEHTEIFDVDSDFTVSKLNSGLYELRMEDLHIGTNTTFSLEVVQTPKAAVLYILRTTPTEFTTGVVDLDR